MSIHNLIEEREKREKSGAMEEYYSTTGANGFERKYLDLRFRTGQRTAFNYDNLSWINFDPTDSCLDLDFGDYHLTICGRGLNKELYNDLLERRVTWLREADTDLEDNETPSVFISDLLITPPEGLEMEAPPAKE